MNTKQRIEDVLSEPYFDPDFSIPEGDKAAIPYSYDPAELDVCVIVGENAGGKSFFRRLVQAFVAQIWDEIEECLHLSMQGRTGSNFQRRFKRAMIYGDEGRWSSGYLSGRSVVNQAISTCQDREHSHLLFWDEPATGASPELERGLGTRIAEFLSDLPTYTESVFITTHSLNLLQEIEQLNPHFLCLGDRLKPSLQEWMERDIPVCTIEDVEETGKRRHDQILAIQDQLSD